MCKQEAGLSVAARRDEAHVDAIAGTPREQVEFPAAVDQKVRRDRPLERERRSLAYHDGTRKCIKTLYINPRASEARQALGDLGGGGGGGGETQRGGGGAAGG